MSEVKNADGNAQAELPGPNDYPRDRQYRLMLSDEHSVKPSGELQIRVMRMKDGRVLFCLPMGGVATWTPMTRRDQWLVGFDPSSLELLEPDVEYGASMPLVFHRLVDVSIK